jgi:hypothetical protein
LPALASALLLCALAACANTATPSSPSAKEKSAMSTETTAPPRSAPLTAQDITPRLLALIADIHSTQDISPELIQKHFGQLGWNNPDYYGVNGKLTETWYYGLSYKAGPPDEKSRSLLFEFGDQTHANADMSSVCVPLEDYKQPLIAAGFTAGRLRNRWNTQDYWTFSRDNLGVTVYLRGKHDPLDETQTCVSRVIIRAIF